MNNHSYYAPSPRQPNSNRGRPFQIAGDSRHGFNPGPGYNRPGGGNMMDGQMNSPYPRYMQPGGMARVNNNPTVMDDPSLSRTNLYFRGLPPNMTDEDLLQLCEGYGIILSTKAIINNQTQLCKGQGFVDFEQSEDAEKALRDLQMRGFQVQMAKAGAQSTTPKTPAGWSRGNNASTTVPHSGSTPQQEDPSLSRTNLYFRGLSPSTTDEDLLEYCQGFGKILSTKSILDGQTQLCKGYGFVDFEKSDDAEKAMRNLRRKGFQVQMAKAQQQAGQEKDETNLYVANLPVHLTDRDLEVMFEPFGTVVSTKILTHNKISRGVGFVRMETREACEEIIKVFNGKLLPRSNLTEPLVVKFAAGARKKTLHEEEGYEDEIMDDSLAGLPLNDGMYNTELLELYLQQQHHQLFEANAEAYTDPSGFDMSGLLPPLDHIINHQDAAGFNAPPPANSAPGNIGAAPEPHDYTPLQGFNFHNPQNDGMSSPPAKTFPEGALLTSPQSIISRPQSGVVHTPQTGGAFPQQTGNRNMSHDITLPPPFYNALPPPKYPDAPLPYPTHSGSTITSVPEAATESRNIDSLANSPWSASAKLKLLYESGPGTSPIVNNQAVSQGIKGWADNGQAPSSSAGVGSGEVGGVSSVNPAHSDLAPAVARLFAAQASAQQLNSTPERSLHAGIR